MKRIAIVLTLSLIASQALAQAAPPAKPVRPLVSVGYGSDFGLFVEAPGPHPGSKVEAWVWMIRKEPRALNGRSYDITASRDLIDCVAWTRTQLYADGFLGETYLGRSPGEGGTAAIGAGANDAVAKVLCGRVNVSKDAPIANIAAALALTVAHFRR